MCRIITLNGEKRESSSWNDINKILKSEEKSDKVFDEMLQNSFMDWYGEDWVVSGIEPTITENGIQNLYGTQYKEFKDSTPSINGLERKLLKFIDEAGIKVEFVDAIKTKLGDNANALVNFMDLTLQVVEGKRNEKTLPEEAAHIYTEYLEQQNYELYSILYNNVVKYPEYAKVKEEYKEEYGMDENLYRKEAIGKVIANRIINQSVKSDTFISLAWNKIKNIVKDAFNIGSAQYRTMFDIAASEILDSKKHYKVRSSTTRLFQLETNTNQTVLNKLISEDALLIKKLVRDEKDGQWRDVYTRLGEEVKRRVTQVVKNKQNFNKQFTEKQQAENDLKSKFGTKMHSAAENITKRYLAKKAGKEVPEKYTEVDAEYYRELETYITNILELPQFENADFLTEVQIYDESGDIAGTIDLLIIDTKGVAHILDYKFITVEGKNLYVKPYKRGEWDEQLKMYKAILSRAYGIQKFGMMRMLPVGIKYNEEIVATGININSEKVFEKAVPGQDERTGNQNLDKIIDNLYADAAKVRANLRLSNEDKYTKLQSIENVINNLKVKQDLGALKQMIKSELNEVAELLNNDTVTSEDLVRMFQLSDYYSTIDRDLNLPELKEIAEKATELSIAFKKQLQLWGKSKNIVFDYIKPVTSFLSNLVSMGSVENPIFRFANKKIQEAQDKKEKEVNRIRVLFNSLKIDSFDSIIDKKHGKLIAQYSSEFYDKSKTSDSKWIKDNVEIREFITINGVKVNAKEDFDARLKRKEEQLTKFSPDIKDVELDKFRSFNDVWSEQYKAKAISNFRGSHRYMQPKEKWHTAEYKALLSNKEADIYKFYEAIKDLIDEANIYSNKHIDARFIPSIEKSIIRKLMSGDFNPQEAAKEMVDSFRIHEYDVNDKIKELSINYTGNIAAVDKSFELKESFLLFADSVYNVKYMSEIEPDIYLAEQLLKNSNYIKTNNLGGAAVNTTGDIITESGKDSKLVTETVDKFNKFVDLNIYGLKNYSDTSIAGFGVNKVLGGALNYNAWLKIGGNVLSATSNLVGGKTNQFMEAAKGRFFTTKELASAELSFWSRDAKAMAIIDYFDISTDNNIHKKARNLKISTLDKQFNADWIMTLQNATEKVTQYTSLIAYTKGMTIKDGKIVKKGKEDKSIYDLITIDKDSVNMPDLTDALYGRVRLTVTELNSRLTGAKYDRSKLLYEGDIRWKALAQFKSWVLPMAKERFGTLTYNSNLGLYEEGRAASALLTLFSKHFAPVATSYLKALVTFNSRAIVIGSEKALKERYENFIRLNPNFSDTLNPEEGISFEQYQELYHQNIKSFLRELQMWGLMLSVSLSYASTDDDDKNKTVAKYLDRFNNELSYFYSLDSYMALGGISIPLLTTAKDFINFTGETLNYTWGVATGETELLSPEKIRTKAGKVTLGLHQWDKFYNDLIKE